MGRLNQGSQGGIPGLTGKGFQEGTRGPFHLVPEDRRSLILRIRFLITYLGGQRDVPGLTGEGDLFRTEWVGTSHPPPKDWEQTYREQTNILYTHYTAQGIL
jgi:hypothetical protein